MNRVYVLVAADWTETIADRLSVLDEELSDEPNARLMAAIVAAGGEVA